MAADARSRLARYLVPLFIGASSFGAAPAHAADSVRISIHRPTERDPKLDEAVIRLRGELAAVGLLAEVTATGSEPAETGDPRGALQFERIGSVLRIRARGPEAETEVTQDVNFDAEDVTAEVIAVRAVEALRAAMTRFALREQRRGRAIPESIQGFIELRESPDASPEPESAPSRSNDGPALAPRGGVFSFRFAPGVVSLAPDEGIAPAAELGAFYGRSWLFGGVRLGATLPTSIETPVGDVEYYRGLAVAEFGVALPLHSNLDLFAALGAGVAAYAIEGSGTPGYVGRDDTHLSVVGAAELGAAAFVSAGLAAYAAVGANIAADSADVRVAGVQTATFDRPGLSGALGIALVVP